MAKLSHIYRVIPASVLPDTDGTERGGDHFTEQVAMTRHALDVGHMDELTPQSCV